MTEENDSLNKYSKRRYGKKCSIHSFDADNRIQVIVANAVCTEAGRQNVFLRMDFCLKNAADISPLFFSCYTWPLMLRWWMLSRSGRKILLAVCFIVFLSLRSLLHGCRKSRLADMVQGVVVARPTRSESRGSFKHFNALVK